MKLITRLILISIAFFICILPANAILRGFSLEKYPSDLEFGIGVYFAPKEIEIFYEPDLNSIVKEKLEWRYARVQLISKTGTIENPEDVFLAFYPYKEIAVLAVVDEQKDWVKVIYDQKHKLSGWVYLKKPALKTQYNTYVGDFYTWYDFMLKIAKVRGMYFIPGVPKKYRKLRGQPDDNAKYIRHDFTYVKQLQLKHIRGNWMLVKAIDISQESPYGWIRWRDDNGKLMVFCNLD